MGIDIGEYLLTDIRGLPLKHSLRTPPTHPATHIRMTSLVSRSLVQLMLTLMVLGMVLSTVAVAAWCDNNDDCDGTNPYRVCSTSDKFDHYCYDLYWADRYG